MAEQAVDAGFLAKLGRLKNAFFGVALDDQEAAMVAAIASSVDSFQAETLAHLIERARYAGPGGSSRTTVIDLPGRHRKPVPAVGPSYKRKEETP